MTRRRYYYIINLQYLGFRFSGWQKQPGQKTIESMLTKTLKFVLPGVTSKILGAGRTDAKVSALEGAFELFIDDHEIEDLPGFLDLFNKNLPSDIRVLAIEEVTSDFNIIKDVKSKEYVYLFSFGSKNHPFSAPFIANIIEELDLGLMTKTAKLFEGSHDFSAYTVKAQKNQTVERTIDLCEIRKNTLLTANFFPDRSYALHVQGKGFMRYQIRMIMGALIQLGMGEISYDDIVKSLSDPESIQLTYVAPGSGLLLNQLKLG